MAVTKSTSKLPLDRRKLTGQLMTIGVLILLFVVLNLTIFFVFTRRCLPTTGEGMQAKSVELDAYLPFDDDSAVVDIARKNLGKRVLIATHAAAIRALWGKLSGLSPDEASLAFDFPTNASITRVDFDGERLVPVCYSDDSHLGSSADKLRNP